MRKNKNKNTDTCQNRVLVLVRVGKGLETLVWKKTEGWKFVP